VIEGSLQINTIFDSSSDPLDISTLSFPNLKEITGFLMLFSTQGLPTLNQLFPQLALIRGQELVEDYALLIFKMHG
jgi:insulin receptor